LSVGVSVVATFLIALINSLKELGEKEEEKGYTYTVQILLSRL
jgi:hypothetical protein